MARADSNYALDTGAQQHHQRQLDPLAVAPAPRVGRPADGRLRAQQLLEGRGWTLLRLAVDTLLVFAAVLAAHLGAVTAGADMRGEGYMLAFPPIVLCLLALRGLYKSRLNISLLRSIGSLTGATSLGAMIIVAGTALVHPSAPTASLMARVWLFATAYLIAGRVVLGLTQRRARADRTIAKRTLIVGAGQIGAQVERRLDEQPELGLRPIGYVDSDPAPKELVPGRRAPVLGRPEDLVRITEQAGVDHVILAFSSAPDSVLLPLVRDCEERGIEVSIVPRLFESVNVHVGMEHLGGLPLHGLHSVNPKGWQFAIKHAVDRAVAAVLLLACAPLLVGITLAVKLSSPGPVFFKQRRIGRDGHEFEILKFRTMVGTPADAGEANAGWAAFAVGDADAAPARVVERRTRVGRVLRAYSLDELPQLINVLRGDMSLVGPRPELPHYVRMFERSVHRYSDRHRVKSGLTGWAQVHGLRGNTSLADRVEWDNWYVQNWSLGLDLQILLMTVTALLKPAE